MSERAGCARGRRDRAALEGLTEELTRPHFGEG
jgi:hypothetical protein